MNTLTNEILARYVSSLTEPIDDMSKILLPVKSILQDKQVSLEVYAEALTKFQLETNACMEIKQILELEDAALLVRSKLLNLELSKKLEGDKEISTNRRRIIKDYIESTPYYQPEVTFDRNGLNPVRVEVASSLRVDLVMGGLSDTPPWVNERIGGFTSLCINIDNALPIRCVVEINSKPGIQLEVIGHNLAETILTWEALEKASDPTRIICACLKHLFTESGHRQNLVDFFGAVFGGGLRIEIFSKAPKGLGSSSIIISCLLQALLRLLRYPFDWQEIVHRTVSVERIMGIGGGVEDATSAFWGGVVKAETTPSNIPVIQASKLNLSESMLNKLHKNVVIFNTIESGATSLVLQEGVKNYFMGDPATMLACETLLGINSKMQDALRDEDLPLIGSLLTQQWEAWKIITNGKCTNARIDSIIGDVAACIEGAKLPGAGSGGAIIFVAKENKIDQLLDYLSHISGEVINWHIDQNGRDLKEWFNPSAVATYIREFFPDLIKERASYSRHGEIADCIIETFPDGYNKATLVGPINPKIFELLADVPLTVFVTTAAIVDSIGTATSKNLHSVKKMLDHKAAAVFADEMTHWNLQSPVSTSEGKDERGDIQPAVPLSYSISASPMEFRTAVDPIDGTTLTAKGEAGACSICAVGEGLRYFPDMLAYAFVAPKDIFTKLDMSTPPEKAIFTNLEILGQALGKKVNELVIVTHGITSGKHHTTLIEMMRSKGVTVLTPPLVTIELPYVIASVLNHPANIDAMIGIFGLPEIAICTMLAGLLRRDKEIIFRLASNQPLKNRTQINLEGFFDFTAEEQKIIETSGFNLESLYKFMNITSGVSGIFASAAITDDPILNIKGVRRNRDDIFTQGLFTDPCGNIHKLMVRFHRPTTIDYAARHPMPLFDISLIAELHSARKSNIAKNIRALVRQIHSLVPNVVMYSLFASEERSALHVTLYEFIVDYVSSVDMDSQARIFEYAVEATATVFRELKSPQVLTLKKIKRGHAAIIIEVDLSPELKSALLSLENVVHNQEMFNILATPRNPHLTLARFTDVLTLEVTKRLDEILVDFNERLSGSGLHTNYLSLKLAGLTPFENIRRSVNIYLADR